MLLCLLFAWYSGGPRYPLLARSSGSSVVEPGTFNPRGRRFEPFPAHSDQEETDRRPIYTRMPFPAPASETSVGDTLGM
jgi:hypothetical protein